MGLTWAWRLICRMLGIPVRARSPGLVSTCLIVLLCLSTCLGQVGQRTAGPGRKNQKPRIRIPAEDKIPNAQLENWAMSFGSVLWETARAATRFDAIQKKFHNEGAKTVQVDGFEMVKEMAANVEAMMQHKIDAIKRIMEYGENLALDHKYERDLGQYLKKPPRMGGFHYFNAKKINVIDDDDEDQIDDWDKFLSATDRLEDDDRFRVGYSRVMLEENKHFSGIPVNSNMSSVHVPTNVFDGEPKVVNAIKWSRGLDRVFVDNYNRDPSLSWQYFGSSTGFMRQYPAMKWLTTEHDPDLYDARMRDWYIKSAASPKEIVILLDTSGSMTGLRKEIAKHVVLNILDTLSEDDFVAIYKFSKYPTPLVECFTTPDGRAELVQATNENIREYQEAVEHVQTEEIANFTSALTVAFELLHEARLDPDIGSNCNQAVMIVTDGVPYKYEDIFRRYNMPHKPVRIFTYLIGREISDLKAANHMACQNRGYFAHVTTLAEVKEQVLKYVPVMARPMVMYRVDHPIQWTGVYADVEVVDRKPLWMIKLPRPMRRSKIFAESELRKSKFTGYRLMTSVSIPVFDKNNHTDPESLGLKKNPEGSFLRKVRIAQLLGVAGTDVPIREIEKLTPPHQLGVNGYSFAVNNNGYILYHPDLRPMFQEILKPNYNSVDLAEVELVFDRVVDAHPRANDSELLAMRQDMVNQIKGQSFLTVKQHFDDMKRATVKTMDYFYHPLINTPFSLGVALPQDFGKHRVEGMIDVPYAKFNVSSLFEDRNWRVHPDWIYCQYNYAGEHNKDFATPEENMKHFLIKMQEPGWSWGTPSVRPLPKCTNTQQFDPNCIKCEKDLVNSLVFDAVVTKDFERQRSPHRGRGEFTNETYKRVGIQLAFIATRSGLMRFADHSHLFRDPKDEYLDRNKETPNIKEPHFSDINNKATEEIWYKRAVDYHKVDPKAFVYSIPFDVGEKKTKVTATHAIMVGRGSQKTPAAVAGMQIDYDIFRQMFFNETQKCVHGTKNCNKTCASEDLECYVVDNNGFVVISEDPVDTGKFFGEVDGTILESLIQHNIYRPIRIYDYQAICLEPENDGGSASMLLTPFKLAAWMFNYVLGQIAWTIIRFEIHHVWNPDWTYAFPQGVGEDESVPDYGYNDATYYDPNTNYPYENDNDPLMDEFSIKDGGPIPLLQMTYINKTKPMPCDKQVILYELNDEKLYKPNKATGKPVPVKGKLSNCHESDCERPFSVQLIPHTNLVLIVADKLCPCFSTKISIEPIKIEYGPVNETAYCERLKYNIYRRKPTHCFNYHPEETEIKLCGNGTHHTLSWTIVFVLAILRALYH